MLIKGKLCNKFYEKWVGRKRQQSSHRRTTFWTSNTSKCSGCRAERGGWRPLTFKFNDLKEKRCFGFYGIYIFYLFNFSTLGFQLFSLFFVCHCYQHQWTCCRRGEGCFVIEVCLIKILSRKLINAASHLCHQQQQKMETNLMPHWG